MFILTMYNADVVDLPLSLQKPTEYGDIMFSLSYLPTAERLTIVIVKARNLKWADSSRDYGGQFQTGSENFKNILWTDLCLRVVKFLRFILGEM